VKIKRHIREAIEEERRSGTESLRDGKPIGMEEGIEYKLYAGLTYVYNLIQQKLKRCIMAQWSEMTTYGRWQMLTKMADLLRKNFYHFSTPNTVQLQ